MPRNHLSYYWGIIVTLGILVCGCSSPEQRKLEETREQNRHTYGEGYPEEIDLLELSRQVVFLEEERIRLIAENRFLSADTSRKRHARRYRLLPLHVVYFHVGARAGDKLHFRSLDHPELPIMIFNTYGPPNKRAFTEEGFYFDEPLLYLPGGRYRVEVFNQSVLRFTVGETIRVAQPKRRRTFVDASGKRFTTRPELATLYLIGPGCRVE